MPRNVLLVVLDTARADAIEPYGAPAGSTPAIAQLARSGEALQSVYSTACWTLPAHASMFTGQLPRALGLGQAPSGTPHGARPVLEAQRDQLLPEILRRSGFETRAVSANLWVSALAGFATGFEQFEQADATGRLERFERDELRGRLTWALEGLLARADDGAAQAEMTLRRWIDEPRERPFFWFVNLVECHSPYLPPRPYNDLGAADRLRAADEARRHLSLEAIWRACLTGVEVPEEALERMRHLYARSVRLMDDWLARVLQALDDGGQLEDTLVIVTSDHGENFGEGGLLAHAFSLDDRLTRVPLVASEPGLAPQPRGATSLAALPRMVAQALDLDDHPWGLAPLGETGLAAAQFDFVDADDPRVALASDAWDLDDRGREKLTTPLTSVTDGELKLMQRGARRELYDLTHDPLEEHPVEPEGHPDSERVRALHDALSSAPLWAVPESPPAHGENGTAGSPEAAAEDLERRMKLLGYM